MQSEKEIRREITKSSVRTTGSREVQVTLRNKREYGDETLDNKRQQLLFLRMAEDTSRRSINRRLQVRKKLCKIE